MSGAARDWHAEWQEQADRSAERVYVFEHMGFAEDMEAVERNYTEQLRAMNATREARRAAIVSPLAQPVWPHEYPGEWDGCGHKWAGMLPAEKFFSPCLDDYIDCPQCGQRLSAGFSMASKNFASVPEAVVFMAAMKSRKERT